MADEQTNPLSLAESADFDDFKKRRKEARAGAADAQPKAAEVKPQSEPQGKIPSAPEAEAKSETAGVSETPVPQEKKPKRDNAEDRIKELLREREDRDRKIADLEKRLEQPRTAASESQPKIAEAKPEAKTADPNKPPTLKDFVANRSKEDPTLTYEDLHEEWLEKRDTWRDKQREAQAEQRKTEDAQKTEKDTFDRKMVEVRAKHPDFDQAAAKVVLDRGVIANLAKNVSNGLDVIHHLGINPEDNARVGALDAWGQLAEVLVIARSLASPKAAANSETPEKPQLRPAISRTSPPPRVLSGRDPGADKTTADAESFEEFKAIRHRKAG